MPTDIFDELEAQASGDADVFDLAAQEPEPAGGEETATEEELKQWGLVERRPKMRVTYAPGVAMPIMLPEEAELPSAEVQLREGLKPPVQLPTPTPESLRYLRPAFGLVGAAGAVVPQIDPYLVAGLEQGKGLVETAISPVGIASAAAGGGVLGQVGRRAVAAGFAADMASQVPEVAAQAGEASVIGDPWQRASAYTGLGATVGMPGMLGLHALAPSRPAARPGVRPAEVPAAPAEPVRPAEAPRRIAAEEPIIEIPEAKEPTIQEELAGMTTEALERERTASLRREPTTVETDYQDQIAQELERRQAPAKPAAAAPAPAAPPKPTAPPPMEGGREMQMYDREGPIEVLEVNEAKGTAMVRDAKTGKVRDAKLKNIFQTPKRPLREEPKSIEEEKYLAAEREGMSSDPDVAAALKENEAAGIVSKASFVDTLPDGEPFGPFTVATIDADGNILVNRKGFQEWLRDPRRPQTKAGRAKAIRSLLAEEGIHGLVKVLMNRGLITRAQIESLWNNASGMERGFTNLSYTGKWSGVGRHDAYQMGQEFLRRAMQRFMKMTPREVAELRGTQWLKAEVLELVERAIYAVRKAIRRPNAEMEALLKTAEKNLGAAREGAARGEAVGTEPFAELKRGEEEPLRAALLVEGKPIIGKPGQTHSAIFGELQKGNPDVAMNAMMAFADDSNHVFVDPAGKVLNRGEAAKVFDQLMGNPEGTTTRLHSQEIAKLNAATREPEAYRKPSPEEEKAQMMLGLTPGAKGQERVGAAEAGATIPPPPSATQVEQAATAHFADPGRFSIGRLVKQVAKETNKEAAADIRRMWKASFKRIAVFTDRLRQIYGNRADEMIAKAKADTPPSFGRFAQEMLDRHGESIRPMLRDIWESKVWDRVQTATGPELKKLIKQLGVEESMGRGYGPETKIPDAAKEELAQPKPEPAKASPEYVAWKQQAEKLKDRGALDLGNAGDRQRFREMAQETFRLRRQLRQRTLTAEERSQIEDRRIELETILGVTAQLRRLGGVRSAEFARIAEQTAKKPPSEARLDKSKFEQRIRYRAQALIGEKLIGQSRPGVRMDPNRPTITPVDIGWGLEDKTRGPAWHEFRERELTRADLGARLTQGARVSGEPVSLTRRVTSVRDNLTGEVHVLSTYIEGEGKVPKIKDPNKFGERTHVPLNQFLEPKLTGNKPRFTVLATTLLDDPVREFGQYYRNEADWRARFADPAASERTRRLESGLEPVEVTEAEEPAIEEVRPALQRGGPVTDAEAKALFEHFASEDLTSRGQVEDLFNALRVEAKAGDRPTPRVLQIANALDKIWRKVREQNPGILPEDAMGKVYDWIYENAGTEATRNEFVTKTLGQFAQEDVGVPGAGEAKPAPKTGARELTMLSRKPPTVDPNVVLPKGPGPAPFSVGPREPEAFIKPTVRKTGEIADYLTLRPLRWYSEWMTDRLERTGGVFAKQFSRVFKSMIAREHELYGELSAGIDRARKEAGRLGKATSWLHQLRQITPRTAVANVVMAIENTINVPAYAQRLVALAQQVNIEVGQMLQQVAPGFQASGAFQRVINAFGYDTIREGKGKVFDDWVAGLANANGMAPATVRAFFKRWKTLLDEPSTDTAALERINQDFARKFQNVVTHVKVGEVFGGRWEPIMHADLFNYLENTARRATHVRSFRESYPVGSPMLRAALRSARNELPAAYQPDLDAVVRALQGHPTDNFSVGPLAPGTPTGHAFRFLNQTLGNAMARMVLTGQMMTQAGETIAGATPTFLGYDRYLRALTKYRQLYPELERQGRVNRLIYDMSWDPTQKIRSATRIGSNAVSRAFAESFLNELQEGSAAATAALVAEDIRTGRLSEWDRKMLPVTFKAMDFSESQAAAMMAGDVALLDQFQSKAASWLTSGNKAIAEGSRIGANRLFNSVFRFQSYPMMKMNQFLRLGRVARQAFESGTTAQKVAATRMMGRFMFHGIMQGAITTGITALAFEALYGAKIRKQEAQDNLFGFVLESFLATLSGPAYLVFRGARFGGLRGIGEQALRSMFPYTMVMDLIDMAQGQGQYRDLDAGDRLLKYVAQKVPGTRPMVAALAAVGLSQKNVKLETARKAFYRWRREQPGVKSWKEQEQGDDEGRQFRTHMKQAVVGLQNGDLETYRDAMAEAMGVPGKSLKAAKSSLKSRKVLQFNGKKLDADQMQSLRNRIGDEPVDRLRYYDLMLDRAAEGAILPPFD